MVNSITKFNFFIYKDFYSVIKIWKNLELLSVLEVFQSYDWCESWWENYKNKNSGELNIICIYKNKKVVFLYPLVVKKTTGFKILTCLGEPFNDYNEPIIVNEDVSKTNLINFFFKSIEKEINYDIAILSKQKEWFGKKLDCKIKISNDGIGRYVHIKTNWDTYYKKFSKKKKYNNRRAIKLLKKNGDVYIGNTHEEDVKDTLYKLLKFKSDFYNRINVHDIFNTNSSVESYIGFILGLYKKGCVDISVVKLNNQIIAAHCGFYYKKHYYYSIPSYDLNYRSYSPGTILLFFLVEKSFHNRDNVFDFTIGGENYKKSWCNSSNKLFTLYKHKTLKGFVYYVLSMLKHKMSRSAFLRRVYKRLFL